MTTKITVLEHEELAFKVKSKILKGEFVLKSGQKSNYYMDLRSLFTNPYFLKHLVDYTRIMIEEHEIDILMCDDGLPMLWAGACEIEIGVPTVVFRKGEKDHGIPATLVHDCDLMNKNVLILDDVFTTGGSISRIISALPSVVKSYNVLVVIDRSKSKPFLPYRVFSSIFRFDEETGELK